MNNLEIMGLILFLTFVILLSESRIIKPVINKHKVNFYNIQILRGLAALQVLVFHMYPYVYGIAKQHTIFDFHQKVMPVGFGAWFFFVISGFIMGHLIHTNYNSFLMRRFLRIYPIYIITAMIILCVKICCFGAVSNKGLFQALTLFPGHDRSIDYPLFIEWTLLYEVFFYLVCSIFALGNNKRFFLPFVIIWFAAITLFQIFENVSAPMVPDVTNIAISAYNVLFIFGVIAYHIFLTGKERILNLFVKKMTAVWALIVVGLSVMVMSIKLVGNTFFMLLFFGAASGMIIVIVSVLEIGKDAMKQSFLQKLFIRIGDYSYGIYLIHANFLAIVISLMVHRKIPVNSFSSFILMCLTLAVGCIWGKFDISFHKKLSHLRFPINLCFNVRNFPWRYSGSQNLDNSLR